MVLIYLFVVGLAIGSFLNVLSDRLPKGKSILGRSQCDFCHKKLSAKDLVPVFSFLLLQGRCRYCNRKLSVRYPMVELLTGLFFIISWVYLPETNVIVKIFSLGLISGLIVIFFADWKYTIIPDQIIITLLLFSISIFYLTGGLGWSFWLNHLLAGVTLVLPLLLIYLITKGRGMGLGDVKFAFVIGFYLGLIAGFFALYFAFIAGAIFGLILVFIQKKKLKDAIAFGPFLALGFLIMLFFGQQIINFFTKFYF